MKYLGILCYKQGCRLEASYQCCVYRCPGASHRRVALERRKTSKLQAEAEGESGPGGPEQPSSLSPDADQGMVPAEPSFTSPALPAWTDEPGIDNPPFEENTLADSMSALIFSSLFHQMWEHLWCQSSSLTNCECASSSLALFFCNFWRNISGFWLSASLQLRYSHRKGRDISECVPATVVLYLSSFIVSRCNSSC